MTLLLADLDDVREWLTEDKISITEGSVIRYQVEAYRIIKSQLAGVFTPAILQTWASPDTTPPIIRGVAGRLIAAYIYRNIYSEDAVDVPPYAQQLYNEAIGIINEIKIGQMTVVDDNDEPIAENQLTMTKDDFWPNDKTPGPYFTMEQEFA